MGERYEVKFRNEETMPHCTCYDWRKSAYPCKHFFAIFSKYPAWSWDSLPQFYRNSPFFILDEIFEKDQDVHGGESHDILTTEIADVCSEVDYPSTNEPTKFDTETLSRKKRTTAAGPHVRELLDQLRRLSFLIEDKPDIVEKLQEDLADLKDNIYNLVSTDKGIHLRPPSPKKNT